MGNKTFRRIEDFFRHGADMKVRCACGHDGTLDPYRVYRWYALHGWNAAMETVPMHLRCSACGKRPVAVIPVPKTECRLSDAWFPRDDAGWRALQRRLRG